MIRSFLLSLLFFFGPVILMFALRYLGLLLRFWLRIRQQQKRDADVIDVTPRPPGSPSILFIILAIAAGLLIAVLAWQRLTDHSEDARTYIPAHINQQGQLVPGHFRQR